MIAEIVCWVVTPIKPAQITAFVIGAARLFETIPEVITNK